jgi:hypothetical protein
MKIKGETTFPAGPETVWAILLDPEIISRCIPGCQELRETGPDTFVATLRIGIGAVSGVYEGTLRITDRAPPSRYAMVFEGAGRGGFVRGIGEARLRAESGTTVLAYDCDVEVGGLIASVGQRVLEGVSTYLVGQMFAKLQGHAGRERAA